jgi:hypothetical protein
MVALAHRHVRQKPAVNWFVDASAGHAQPAHRAGSFCSAMAIAFGVQEATQSGPQDGLGLSTGGGQPVRAWIAGRRSANVLAKLLRG